MPHHILLSASEVRIKCILVITFKGILLVGHRLRFYCPDHSFPLTPPRGGGMTSWWDLKEKQGLLFNVLKSSTLMSKSSSKAGGSDCSIAIHVEMVNPFSSGLNLRKPSCWQISATFFNFNFINSKGEVWSYFPIHKSGEEERIFIRLLWNPIVLTCAREACSWGWRSSMKITGVAFSKCICSLPPLLSQLTSLHPSPCTCAHWALA